MHVYIMRTGLLLIVLCQTIGNTLAGEVQGYDVGDCIFEKHNDYINKDALRKLATMVGKSYTATDADLPHVPGEKTYRYSIGVCIVPPAYQTQPGFETASAVQSVVGSHDQPHILGDIKQAELMSGKEWVLLEYEGGQKYNQHCGGEPRRTLIMMICSPGQKEGRLRIIEENNNKTSDCFYLFELEHDNICEAVSSSGLSIGSIVVIVFLALVTVYLVGGFLYQRFIVGSKGLEQIPNFHFWKDFGNLQADGCDLVCRCGRRQATQMYRGIGDEQISNTAEGEDDYMSNQDDHLLPM